MNRRTLLVLAAFVQAGLLATSASTWSDPSEWRPVVQPLPSPAGTDSAQPQITVSSRGALLSWVERAEKQATLKFSEYTPTGWSIATTVARGDDWFVNWADVPSVMRLDDGTLAAHWLQKSGPETYAYDVRLSYSRDEGRSWSPSFLPHHDGLKREHGFASLFQMRTGHFGLIWLDGRNMTSAEGHGGHEGGSMTVRFASFDDRWRQTAETEVDTRVCECCPTSAVMTSDGPVAAFRNRTDDEIRDIYVSRFDAGRWTTPVAVHHDNWKIAACPVNGPMLSAAGRQVVVAWFTAAGDVGRAYAAFSKDAGRTFGHPVRLDEVSALGRVDVAALPDGSAVATWIEGAAQRSAFMARRVDSAGRRSRAIQIAGVESARSSGYPRVAFDRGRLIFAWTAGSAGRSEVKTAVAPIQ